MLLFLVFFIYYVFVSKVYIVVKINYRNMELRELIYIIVAILIAVAVLKVFMWILPLIIVLIIAFFIYMYLSERYNN